MKIETSEAFEVSDEIVFVDLFEVSLEEEGLVVRMKSPLFANFIGRLRGDMMPVGTVPGEPGAEPPAFDFSPHEWKNCNKHVGDDYLYITLAPQRSFLIENQGGGVLYPNLSFLLVKGLETGIEITSSFPVSVADSLDFYRAAAKGLQDIYMKWLRPFNATSKMKEILR